jgi:hypothetical protein
VVEEGIVNLTGFTLFWGTRTQGPRRTFNDLGLVITPSDSPDLLKLTMPLQDKLLYAVV